MDEASRRRPAGRGTSRWRTLGIVTVAGLFALGMAACDEDGEDAADETAEEVEEVVGEGVDDGVLEIDMVDFEFVGLPESVPAGTELAVTNSSAHELHEVVAFRLPDDETRSAEELMELPQEELEQVLGGPPVTVLLAEPDGPQIVAVGDGVLDEPGRYLLICAIPTGIDPEEYLEAAEAGPGPPEVEGGGPPHFVHGMYAELLVE